MLTGEIQNQIDAIWNAFWSGGISNPLEVIEQITYLLFVKRLDDLHTLEENKATRTGKPIENAVFPKGKDDHPRNPRPYSDLRWSHFKHFAPADMYEVVGEHVFPFLRTLGGEDSTYAHHMKDAASRSGSVHREGPAKAGVHGLPGRIRRNDGYRAAGLRDRDNFERFRDKAGAFLRAKTDHTAIRKLRANERLNTNDLADLERMLLESKVGGTEELERAKSESHGLGVFVRSLVGLDREAAKRAFALFLAGKSLGANQIEFVNMVIDHLTEHGVLAANQLYESPFTDIASRGPDGLFTSQQIDDLVLILKDVSAVAAAA